MAETKPVEPLSPGSCVICGKETFDRCSKCARGGVMWMCFCSRDHQKLIWSIHKRVCGRPFEWPALEPEEVEEMVKISTTPLDLGAATSTWIEHWTKQNSDTESLRHLGRTTHIALFKRYLKSLGDTTEHNPSKAEMLKENRGVAFLIKRRRTFDDDGNMYDFPELRRLVALDPFGHLALSQGGRLELFEGCQDATWLSDLQHRMIILVATFALVHCSTQSATESTAQLEEAMKFMVCAMKEVEKLAREVIQVSHPQEAKSILEDYLPDVMNTVGLLVAKPDDVNLAGLSTNKV